MVQETETAAAEYNQNLNGDDNRNWFFRVLVIERKNLKSLAQITSSLKAEAEILSKSPVDPNISGKEAILLEVASQLNNINTESGSPESWNDAYYVEQLVTSLYCKSRVTII